MRNSFLSFIVVIVLLLIYALSSSSASICMGVFTILFGCVLVGLLSRNNVERSILFSALFFSFSFATFLVIMQWLAIELNYDIFADPNNDHYKFFIASQDGETASSITSLFNKCILEDVYWENGGYYFLIQSTAYIATTLFDGNCILLQQLGSSACFVWSSIFLCKILIHFFGASDKVGNYTFFYIAFCPLVLHSIGIHRDPHIALLYMILIYLALLKEVNLRIVIYQLVIVIILYYIRQQHGLFAITFIGLSLLMSKKRSKWIIFIVVLIILASVGATTIYSLISDNLSDTNEYYYNYREVALDGINSGLGRYVYILPTPFRELAQIIVLQMKFPPWGAIENSSNLFTFTIGLETFFIAFLWFYVFVCLVSCLIKYGFSQLPKSISYGLGLLAIFLLLNSSNLESRRVVCMYPFMFIPYLYFKERIATHHFLHLIKERYIIIYASLCVVYLIFKLSFG